MARKTKVPNGFIIYRGPSQYTGQPIIVIATMKSANRKTGNVIQTWILREDVDPVTARQNNQESANCNLCTWRNNMGCYVNVGQAPLAVFTAYHAGRYPTLTAELKSAIAEKVRGRMLRIGSYGDPTASPLSAWQWLIDACRRHVGYTHSPADEWRPYLMASVETEKQAERAHKRGWRTFRTVRNDTGHDLAILCLDNELPCLAETHGITCDHCGLCDGARENPADNPKSIIMPIHGPTAIRMVGKID